ncbi:hypothetical protein QMQ05_03850 [Glutamicibacter ectropisis]|uniref:Helicase n=1 Tax=Glutamicibacter ectropisis TaxID=3046593 RepID=A0AAU6WFY1_9MICC
MDPLTIEIGSLDREEIMLRLDASGVELNAHAQQLLLHSDFAQACVPMKINLLSCSVKALGLPDGGTLPQIYARARHVGLDLCPIITGPYLRLVHLDQESSGNSTLSAGMKPADSLTIASPILGDDDYPKGFYLRVVDSVPWLRGYRCDERYEFAPRDTFIFQQPA